MSRERDEQSRPAQPVTTGIPRPRAATAPQPALMQRAAPEPDPTPPSGLDEGWAGEATHAPRKASAAAQSGPVPRSSMGPVPRGPPPPAPSGGPTMQPRRPPPGATGAQRPQVAPRFFPPQPRSLQETGLSQTFVEELVLKALFFAGELRGSEISQRLKLPNIITDEIVEGLRKQKYIDLKGSGSMGVGKSSMIFQLTTFATELMRQILDRNRYNGPAPVRLEDWFEAVAAQSLRGSRIQRAKMEDKFGELIIKDYVYDGLGPAMNSGRAIFFFGAPGNGKTAMCQSLIRCYDGDIYVPHALLVDDFVIRVFDATLHEERPEDPNSAAPDSRWVRCARPLVVVGGELTLETLDLIYSTDVKYYEAPFQLKATNGMLLVDDFGRQKVSPKDLLNRWIVPLENDVDYLTLHTGKKLKVPFDVFTAFSTNLDPADLVDDAFLRRVRYKLEVQAPDEEQFHQIWELMCRKRRVPYDANAVQYLIDRHYKPARRPFAACQPRDLLEQVIDISHYRGLQPQLSEELIDLAVQNYFVKFKKQTPA